MKGWKAWLAVAVGLLMLSVALITAARCLPALRYASTTGTVLSTRIDSVVSGRTDLHTPVVEYRYRVSGLEYSNDAWNRLRDSGTERWARRTIAQFRPDDAVTVYYDPRDPRRSVLSRMPNTGSIWIMVLTSVLGGVQVLGGVLLFRASRRAARCSLTRGS